MRGAAEIYVAYGLFVTTRSLLVATDAWPQISGPLQAIETFQRERAGSTSKAAVFAVPDEIWDMIVSAVRNDAFHGAEQGILPLAICDDCRAAESAGHALRRLLDRYGLAFPNAATVGDNPKCGLYDELNDNAAYLISLPTQSRTSRKPNCPDAAVILQEDYSDGVFDLCTDVPDDADHRFVQLVKDLDLVVVDVTDGPIGRVSSDSQGALDEHETRSGADHRPRRYAESSTVNPRWRLIVCKNYSDYHIYSPSPSLPSP